MIITSKEQILEIKTKIKTNKYLNDEKVWTYLFATLVNNSDNKINLIKKIINDEVKINKNIDIWFEAQPLSPRKGKAGFSEGNTKLDLSFGGISKRSGTTTGIEYYNEYDWVCFMEAKLYSDCSNDISYDPFRNQIARVIENLLTFQKNGLYPNKIFFTLLTPKIFKNKPFSKLYGYKYFEYHDSDNLIKEFEACYIPTRNAKNWTYPKDIRSQLNKLKLNWITYEEIIEEELKISNFDLSDINNKQYAKAISALKNLFNITNE